MILSSAQPEGFSLGINDCPEPPTPGGPNCEEDEEDCIVVDCNLRGLPGNVLWGEHFKVNAFSLFQLQISFLFAT